jgi:hypothetical protein
VIFSVPCESIAGAKAIMSAIQQSIDHWLSNDASCCRVRKKLSTRDKNANATAEPAAAATRIMATLKSANAPRFQWSMNVCLSMHEA